MKKSYKWSFRKMHPSLQVMTYLLSAVATVGWMIGGMWFLYFVMGR